MDMDLTLMLSLDTALNLILRPLEDFPELSREKQAEILWEYTNLVYKFPKTDMFFSFWREAAICDVRDALTTVKTTSERSTR